MNIRLDTSLRTSRWAWPLIVLVACVPEPIKPTPGPVQPPSPSACQAACIGLRTAQCREGYPTPGGITCLELCERSPLPRQLACWAEAKTSTDVVRCGGTRCTPITPD